MAEYTKAVTNVIPKPVIGVDTDDTHYPLASKENQELIALLLAQFTFSGTSLNIAGLAPATAGTISDIDLDGLPTLILDANPDRKQLIITTTGDAVYLASELAVTPSHYTISLPKKGIWDLQRYTGPIWGCTDGSIIGIKVTEFI